MLKSVGASDPTLSLGSSGLEVCVPAPRVASTLVLHSWAYMLKEPEGRVTAFLRGRGGWFFKIEDPLSYQIEN